MRVFLLVFIILLWLSSYEICEYFYSNDLRAWWKLRTTLYSLIIALSFTLSSLNTKNKFVKFVLQIAIGFAYSDFIDRAFYNTREFRANDIVMILITFAFAIYDYKKNERRN
tara:strand:+ start:96 stop:431 length:336 start_codon:yes stop_codon:yes gene_type:complete